MCLWGHRAVCCLGALTVFTLLLFVCVVLPCVWPAGCSCNVYNGLRYPAILWLPGLCLFHLGHHPVHGSHQRRVQICKTLMTVAILSIFLSSLRLIMKLKGLKLRVCACACACACLDSVSARDSADCYVNATGPKRPVEPAGPRPLCTADHGHCMGKTLTEGFCKTPLDNLVPEITTCIYTHRSEEKGRSFCHFAKSLSFPSTGVPRGAAATLLPAFLAALGLLPDPGDDLCPRWDMLVCFRCNRG